MIAYLADCGFCSLTLRGIERDWRRFELAFGKTLTAIAGRKIGRFVSIVEPINRAALIAVKPCAITSEGYEIPKRYVGVVPHPDAPCRLEGLLDPIRSRRWY
jgi:hypothetical protein